MSNGYYEQFDALATTYHWAYVKQLARQAYQTTRRDVFRSVGELNIRQRQADVGTMSLYTDMNRVLVTSVYSSACKASVGWHYVDALSIELYANHRWEGEGL